MRTSRVTAIFGVLGLGILPPLQAQRLIPDSLRAAGPAFELPVWSPVPSTPPTSLTLQELEGQVVVLDFWARHCVPCVPIHAALVERAPEWQAQGIRVVSVLTWEDPVALGSFFESQGGLPPFPILLDPPGTLIRALESYAMPFTAILDHRGRVAWRRLGGFSPTMDLQRLLPPLLADRDGRPVPRNPNRLTY